jgi:hypothetical protein
MKQTTPVEETLLSATHPQLEKHISVKQIIVSSSIALSGVIGIIFSFVVDKSESTLSMAFLSIGIILMLFALYRLFTKSKETIYKPTGSKISLGSLYMDTVELQNLKQMMVKNEFSSSSRLAFKEGGNGRLDYQMSKDGRFVAIQLLQFVPYTYEAVTGVYYYTDDDALVVAHCINQ